MSAAQDLATPAALWNASIWTTSLNASAETDTRESSARLMLMTVHQAHAGMVGSVQTLLEIMNVAALKDGLENSVKLTRRGVTNPPVKTMLCAWTSSKTSSVPAPQEPMANAVKPLLRGALETHV